MTQAVGVLEAIERGGLSGVLEVRGAGGRARIRFQDGAIVDVRDACGELESADRGGLREALIGRMAAGATCSFEEVLPHLAERPSDNALLVRPVAYPIEPSTPAPRGRVRWARLFAAANAVLLVIALGATALVAARGRAARPAPRATAARLSADVRELAAAAVPLAPRPPATTAELSVGARAAGHRVFVDGSVVGEGAGTYTVPCGVRRVRIGSAGVERELDLACGSARDID